MKLLHVFSGGLDSTVMLGHLMSKKAEGDELVCVNFSYGSKHNVLERRAAKKIAKLYGVQVLEVKVDLNGMGFKSSLLAGQEAIPEGHYAEENMKSTVVPFRNGIMLSIAAGLAESIGARIITYGAHSGDHAIYPDCRPEFFKAMQAAIKLGTAEGVSLAAPFINENKTSIVTLGKALGMDKAMGLSYSCYKGEEMHCGVCGACNERKEAFKLNGISDPTTYAEIKEPAGKGTLRMKRAQSTTLSRRKK